MGDFRRVQRAIGKCRNSVRRVAIRVIINIPTHTGLHQHVQLLVYTTASFYWLELLNENQRIFCLKRGLVISFCL